MKKYTIAQGKHFPQGLNLNLYIGKTFLHFRARFGSSCRYEIGQPDQDDICKLTGLTPGFIRNRNSARWGWRFDVERDQVELLYYCQVKGNLEFGSIGFVNLEQDFEASLEASSSQYIFKLLKPTAQEHTVAKNNTLSIGYRNVPYFGGNQTAPHDMELWIEVLKMT
ncbi:MAG: hypothetical protein WD077_09840 [Bacteroidia bacterium]